MVVPAYLPSSGTSLSHILNEIGNNVYMDTLFLDGGRISLWFWFAFLDGEQPPYLSDMNISFEKNNFSSLSIIKKYL